MSKEKLREALEKLEETYHSEEGYGVKEILSVLNTDINRKNEKQARARLRAMISK